MKTEFGIGYCVALGLIFCFVFGLRLSAVGGLNLGLLFPLAIVWLGLARLTSFSFRGVLALILCFLSLLAVYHFILATLYGNDPSFFISICASSSFSLIFSWFFARTFFPAEVDVRDALVWVVKLFVFSSVINSAFIVVEYFSPETRALVESVIYRNQLANIDYATHPFRMRGLAAGGGAALSMMNAIAALLLFELTRLGFISFRSSVPGVAVLSIANIFTGRTGLIVTIVIFGLLLLLAAKQSGWRFFAYTVGGLFVAALMASSLPASVLDLQQHAELIDWAFEWAGAMDGDGVSTKSTSELATMLFLPQTFSHLFFGVGFFEGYMPIYGRSDSGYVKTLFSIGIILSLLLYSLVVFLLLGFARVERRFSILSTLMVVLLLVAEIKEPFVYQNYTGRFVFFMGGICMFLAWRARCYSVVDCSGNPIR